MTQAVLTAIISGAAASVIWWVGAYLAFWRKRWLLIPGFFLAGCVSLVFSLVASDEEVPGWVVTVAADMRTVVALLVVGSFVWNQPRGERPVQWRP